MRRHLMRATKRELVDVTSEFSSSIVLRAKNGTLITGQSNGGARCYSLSRPSDVVYVGFDYNGALKDYYAFLYGKKTNSHPLFISQEHPYNELETGTEYLFKVSWPEGADVLYINGSYNMQIHLYKYK